MCFNFDFGSPSKQNRSMRSEANNSRSAQDNYENKLHVKDLEEKIAEYQRIINENDREMENSSHSNRACSFCFEEYTNDRKQVAFGPCGHSPICTSCFTAEKGTKVCPICFNLVKFSNLCVTHATLH